MSGCCTLISSDFANTMDASQLALAVVVATTTIFVTAFISFAIIARAAFNSPRVGAPKSLGMLLQRGNFLRVITTLMVVMALIFIEVLNRLDGAAVGVLGAIGGFAIGGMDKSGGSPGGEHDDTGS